MPLCENNKLIINLIINLKMEKYLKLYGFHKTKNDFWIRGDGWLIMIYKPYYATNRWKVELKNHSFLITNQFDLAKLMRALIEDWDLTDFPYNYR